MLIPSERLADALPQAIAAMSEPMVSHDCVAFWLLSEAVRRERKVVQSGQGADEVLGGYYWYPPLLDADGTRLDATPARSSTATTRACARCSPTRPTRTCHARSRARWFERAGRRDGRSTAHCASTPR